MADLTPRQHQIMGILSANPTGLSRDAVGGMAALGFERTGEVLRALRDLGLAACSSSGRGATWFTADCMSALPPRRKTRITEASLRARCCEDGDCLLWQKGMASSAPNACDGRRSIRVRRLMYELVHGEVPEGRNVIASCWNRHCIAPEHLAAVTKREQMRSASAAGRLFAPSRATKNMVAKRKTAKLTIEMVREMRARRVDGETLHQLAKAYQVHVSRVQKIVTLQAWRESASNTSVFNQCA